MIATAAPLRASGSHFNSGADLPVLASKAVPSFALALFALLHLQGSCWGLVPRVTPVSSTTSIGRRGQKPLPIPAAGSPHTQDSLPPCTNPDLEEPLSRRATQRPHHPSHPVPRVEAARHGAWEGEGSFVKQTAPLPGGDGPGAPASH